MRWRLMITGLALSLAANAVADDDVKLSGVEKTPEGLTEQILAAVEPKGVQVGGKNGPICTIWP
jgi:hypothetical protein